MNDLTGKQFVFATEYIKCLNATEAARRAGYKGNDATIRAIASENLTKPNIASFIERLFRDNVMSAAEVLHHLSAIGRGDIDDVLDEEGNVSIKAARAKAKTRLIKKVKQRSITVSDKDGEGTDIYDTEIEMYDRLKALDMLAKYHNLINTIRVADWRMELVALIQNGSVTIEQAMNELGDDLATELFNSAGVPISTGGESTTPD